jgi:ElaB/YqjD/DUF883 family membrane-anchored ribosome-binding protein
MKTTEYTSAPAAPDHRSKGDGTLHKAVIGAHRIVDKVADAAEETTRKVAPAFDRAAELAHRAVDNAAAAVTPVAERLSEQSADLKTTQNRLVADMREYVVANPLTSVGMALATGILLVSVFG